MSVQLAGRPADATRPAGRTATRQLSPKATSISFIITCKGRLHHLQQSLPLLMAQEPDEVIVVDYDCPQKSGEWVHAHFKQVKAVRTWDTPTFNVARARNIGAGYATSKWLCFIDADVLVQPGWVSWLRKNLRDGFVYTVARPQGTPPASTHGTCVCQRVAYRAINGYDDVMKGWGGEDDDFYYRLRRLGLRAAGFPWESMSVIAHTHEERTKFYDERDRTKSFIINRLYRLAKYQAMEFFKIKGELEAEMRQEIYREIHKKFRQWSAKDSNGADLPRVRFTITGEEVLSPEYAFSKKCVIDLCLVTRQARV